MCNVLDIHIKAKKSTEWHDAKIAEKLGGTVQAHDATLLLLVHKMPLKELYGLSDQQVCNDQNSKFAVTLVHYLSASMSPKSLRWAISPFPNIWQAKNMLANLDAKANVLYVPGALYSSCLHTIHVSYLIKSLLIVYFQEYLSFSLTLPPHVPTFPLS